LDESLASRLADTIEGSLHIDASTSVRRHAEADFPNDLHQKTRLFSDVSLVDEKQSH
jgi:hypothetical protein